MDEEENKSKQSIGSSVAKGFTAAATGYADYKKNKENAKNSEKNDSAKNSLVSSEKSALKPSGSSENESNNPVDATRFAENSSRSLFTGQGKAAVIGKVASKTKAKKMIPLMLIGGVILGMVFLVFAFQSTMKLGTIIRNLSTSLGFDNTADLIEEKCITVSEEVAKSGKMSEDYYSRLLENGIEVGQVTLAGEFVRTNTYLAYLDEDIASTDDSYSSETGELVFRFNGEIITADNFDTAVKSDPVLYAAYSNALDASARYYYSDEVSSIYSELGITRAEFSSYEETSDDEANYESFSELVKQFLNKGNETTIEVEPADEVGLGTAGDYTDCYEEIRSRTIPTSSVSNGSSLVSLVDDATHDWSREVVGYEIVTYENPDGTTYEVEEPIVECVENDGVTTVYEDHVEKTVPDTARNDEAATLLSTALSSLEPYLAIKAFMVVAEPIQQVQAGENGPINQLMNMLDVSTEVTIKDAETGGDITTEESIMTNQNFLAAITFEEYSADEAYNFSRDRTLKMTVMDDEEGIKNDNSATGKQQSAADNDDYEVSYNSLYSASDVLESSIYTDKSETFTSTIGANQIVEGGAMLNNKINSVIGSLASDSTTIAKYQQEIDTIVARKAEAERATLSPFDITSKNTFLGSIVYNFATALTYYSAKSSSNLSVISLSESLVDVAKDSIASITGLVSADNYKDGYLGTNGKNCTTLDTTSGNELDSTNYDLSGDIYCTQHETVDTDYLSFTLADFLSSEIGGDLNSEGEIVDTKYIMKVLVLGSDSGSSVGVSSSEACRREDSMGNLLQRLKGKIKDLLGVACSRKQKEDGIATGTAFSLSDSNTKDTLKEGVSNSEIAHLSSAYALYQMAREIVGEANEVSIAREKYYEENPRDTSAAGIIAYYSGMTKEEATIALAYADYLNYLAKYDPSTRYSFVADLIPDSSPLDNLKTESDFYNMTYALISKEFAYSDVRNRLVAVS